MITRSLIFLGAHATRYLFVAQFVGVLPSGADPGIFLFFAVAQPPIFMLPAMMLPFYRRMVGR